MYVLYVQLQKSLHVHHMYTHKHVVKSSPLTDILMHGCINIQHAYVCTHIHKSLRTVIKAMYMYVCTYVCI